MRLEISFTNEYGEEFETSREVANDWADMDEKEFLLDTYKNFLNNIGYALDKGDKVVIQHEVAFNNDNYMGKILLTNNELKENAKEISNLVIDEINKIREKSSFA